MSNEHKKISTLAGVATLDKEEISDGYWSGMRNEPEPTAEKSNSFFHGWRNGMVDGGHAEIDAEQMALIDEWKATAQMGMH